MSANASTFHRLYLELRYTAPRAITHAWQNLFSYRPVRLQRMDYEEYWVDDLSTFEADERAVAFESLVEQGASVADLGCGDGRLLARLKRARGATVQGFDVSHVAVQKARARGVDADVWNGSTDPLPGSYDYITIADCLEHLPEPEQLLERVRGRFRKQLLISIPNSCYWRYRFRVLFGKFMVQWVAHPGEHLRFWSIADMRWWLEQNGFRATAIRPTWGIPLLKHVWPAMFAQNVVYVIEHADGVR